MVALKKTIRGLEEKTQEQEEELDDQAGKIQMLEQVRTEHANEILHYVGYPTNVFLFQEVSGISHGFGSGSDM